MPDFNQPKMKKPDLVHVEGEKLRPIKIVLIPDGKDQPIKIDYRDEILRKRKENEELKL